MRTMVMLEKIGGWAVIDKGAVALVETLEEARTCEPSLDDYPGFHVNVTSKTGKFRVRFQGQTLLLTLDIYQVLDLLEEANEETKQ